MFGVELRDGCGKDKRDRRRVMQKVTVLIRRQFGRELRQDSGCSTKQPG